MCAGEASTRSAAVAWRRCWSRCCQETSWLRGVLISCQAPARAGVERSTDLSRKSRRMSTVVGEPARTRHRAPCRRKAYGNELVYGPVTIVRLTCRSVIDPLPGPVGQRVRGDFRDPASDLQVFLGCAMNHSGRVGPKYK